MVRTLQELHQRGPRSNQLAAAASNGSHVEPGGKLECEAEMTSSSSIFSRVLQRQNTQETLSWDFDSQETLPLPASQELQDHDTRAAQSPSRWPILMGNHALLEDIEMEMERLSTLKRKCFEALLDLTVLVHEIAVEEKAAHAQANEVRERFELRPLNEPVDVPLITSCRQANIGQFDAFLRPSRLLKRPRT